MEVTLEGHVSLVTGASRGIGKAIAKTFADAGAVVYLSSRKQDALDEAVKEIRQTTGNDQVHAIAAHAGDPQAPDRVIGDILDHYGHIEVLVNNAGTNPHYGSLLDIAPEQTDKIHEVNLRGPLLWTAAAWHRHWKLDPLSRGSVINIASIAGMKTDAGIAYYGVSKAALLHLTQNLAPELGPRVRVNAISPGLVKTDMARALWEGHEESIAQTFPLKRLGEPQDIANAALFLASSMSSWMTGQNVVVDGGVVAN
ncbi:MAG: SDR family oxidoreductase [Acidimicrobiales bacterium]